VGMLGRRGPSCRRRGGGERVMGEPGGDPPGCPPPALAGGGASLSHGLVGEDSRWRRRVRGGPGGCNWENERDFRVWVGGYMVRCGDKIAYFLFYLVAQACLDFKTFKIYRHIESLTTYVEYIKPLLNIKFLPKILSVVTILSWNR
jgi:hypothetical protein